MFVGIFHDLSDDDLGIGWNTYYVREKLIAILDQDDVQLLNCTGSSTDAVSLWLKISSERRMNLSQFLECCWW